MKITACRKCGTPVAQWMEIGLTFRANLTAHTTTTLAQTWLQGHRTYHIRTSHKRQRADHYPDHPHNRRKLVQMLQTRQPLTDTILTEHTCPGELVHIDSALDTWQPHDRAIHYPTPRPPTEGITF